MKKLIYLLFLFFLSPTTYAQLAGAINGQIYDEEGRELEGITVSLLNTSFTTATNSSGSFSFKNLPDGNYTLQVSGIGVLAQKQNLVVKGAPLYVRLRLNAANNSLQEVLVIARKSASTHTGSLSRISTPLTDLPQSIQVVEESLIREQQIYTVDQALRNAAGVNVSSGYGSVNMRGFETNVKEFLTNGMKGSPYPEGVIPLMANIEKIEVIHGASAILYGQGALGGTINMVTKQPKKDTHVNASLGAGSFDLYRAKADITGSLNKSKSLYFLAGAAYQSGGKFTRNFDNQNLQLFGSLKWEAGAKTTWQLNGNFISDRTTLNWQPFIPVYDDTPRLFHLPVDFTMQHSDSRYQGNSFQVQSVLNHRFNSNWSGNLLLGFSRSNAIRKQYDGWGIDHETNEIDGSFTVQTINSPVWTANPYLTGAFKIGSVKNKLETGVDLTLSKSKYPHGMQQYAAPAFNVLQPDYSPFNYANAEIWLDTKREDFTYNTVAYYLQDQLELSRQLKALIGLRYNNYFMRYLAINNDAESSVLYDERPERTESFTPRAGIVYQPLKSASFYVDYNRGFIPQYSNDRRLGGPFDPETSHQFEAGFKGGYFRNRLRPTLALYHINKENVLTYYEDDSLPLGYGYRPLQKVTSKGIEAGITGNITESLFVNLNYSHNDTRITKSNEAGDIGNTFYNAPYHLANAWLSYGFAEKTSLKGLNLAIGLNHVGKRSAYFGSLPAYTVLDAVIGYRYKNYNLQVNANNLTNKVYAVAGGYSDYIPGTPRNFLVTLALSL